MGKSSKDCTPKPSAIKAGLRNKKGGVHPVPKMEIIIPSSSNFVGFQENYLHQFSPKAVVAPGLGEDSKSKKIKTDEGYGSYFQQTSTSTPMSTAVVGQRNGFNTISDISFERLDLNNTDNVKRECIPENFNLEFINDEPGGFRIRASETAMQCVAIWDDQNAQRLARNVGPVENCKSPTLLSVAELQVPDVKVSKIEKMDVESHIHTNPFRKLLFSEDDGDAQQMEFSENSTAALRCLDANLTQEPHFDIEMDTAFSEILNDLGLSSIDERDMNISDLEAYLDDSFDGNLDTGLGTKEWDDILALDREIKAHKKFRQ